MTEKLFYTDSHMQNFEATVMSCSLSPKGYEAVLDRTAFFPEGGGQGADTGYLGDVRVLDVHERAGIIYHLLEEKIEEGTIVSGVIDWEQRFTRMQQHSGEHIVSGLIHERFGYNNVGFHLGDELCTLDVSGPLTRDELREIEEAANEAVYANIPVEVLYPSKEALAEMEYRSKIEIEGQVRIVRIGEVDTCACCAPHVNTTGEIGMIKFVQWQNYKGGVRITMVCGRRALKDYRMKEDGVKKIMASLCAKEELIAEAVERLKEENSSLKNQIHDLQRGILESKALAYEGRKRVCVFETLTGNLPKEYMNLLLKNGAELCAVFSKTEDGYRYVIGSAVCDVRPISKKLNEEFAGRGGGKPDMVQGTLHGAEADIRKVFEEL